MGGTRRLRPVFLSAPFLVPAALALVLWISDHPLRAAVLGGVLAVFTVTRFVVGPSLDARTARATAAVGRTFGWIMSAIFHSVVVMPAWAVRSIVGSPTPVSGWTDISASRSAGAGRSFGREGGAAPRTRRERLLRAGGVIGALVVVNYAVGFTYDLVSDRTYPTAPTITNRINLSGRKPPPDPLARDPAMKDAPWSEDLFDEMNSIPATYWPFVLYRDLPASGRYVNVDGWTRRSYRPRLEKGQAAPLLSFYGGSTTFGVAQRDLHTIPSEVARLAEREGLPVRVVNHGMRGFVSWAEMHIFEHFTDAGERPALAVFYDGTNEIYAQRQRSVRGNPTDTEVDQVGARLSTPPPKLRGAEGPAIARPRPSARDLWDAYVEHSGVHKAARWAKAVLAAAPAGAEELPPSGDYEAEERSIGLAAVSVYERSREIIEDVARRGQVEPMFFWQPIPSWNVPGYRYRVAVDHLTKPTISIADCLDDHQEVYLADSHTNEAGARLVARCMWGFIEPKVRAWYRSNSNRSVTPSTAAATSTTAVTRPSGPAIPRIDISAPEVGAGWERTGSVPVLGGALSCLFDVGGVAQRDRASASGPSFSLDPSIGRGFALVSVLRAPSDRAAAALVEQSGGRGMQDCLGQFARGGLSADGPVKWVPAAKHPTGVGSATGVVQSGTVTIAESGAPRVGFAVGVVQRGPLVYAVQVITTNPGEGDRAAVRVLVALGGD